MTARLLQLLLLLQAALVAGLSVAAMRYLGIGSAWLALAVGALALLLLRLLVTAHSFFQSWRFRSSTPAPFWLGPAARLRLFAEEWGATLRYSSWTMTRARAHQTIHGATKAPPVLLLHGYGCNSGYWADLTRLFDAGRISHAALDLEPLTCDIDAYVPQVRRALDALRAADGASQVVIVAHSMGGLVARAYLRAHGGALVARVITLGTPHNGTRLANFGIGRNAGQMRCANGPGEQGAWLRALGGAESAAMRALITSIYTHHDNIVAPQTSAILDGARNIAFGGVGHVALGRNPRVLACVMHQIMLLKR